MRRGTYARPTRGRRSWWRVGTPVVVLLSGALFAVSADNSDGTDLRPGRYTSLESLTASEADRYARLQARVQDLNKQVADLADQVQDTRVKKIQREVDALKDPAGLEQRTGPGLTVTLSDAPADVIQAADEAGADVNRYIVHQQDIQAVVNAMWKGGAQAITLQGQRLISTTGIKCEGNSVLLQGVPYPSPYVIQVVGDVGMLSSSVLADPDVLLFREDADRPEVSVGFDLAVETEVKAPAYAGLLDLSYATPVD